MLMKNPNDIIGNRTRVLPKCSAVPQPTAPPRAPSYATTRVIITKPVRMLQDIWLPGLSAVRAFLSLIDFARSWMDGWPYKVLCMVHLATQRPTHSVLIPLSGGWMCCARVLIFQSQDQLQFSRNDLSTVHNSTWCKLSNASTFKAVSDFGPPRSPKDRFQLFISPGCCTSAMGHRGIARSVNSEIYVFC